VPLDHESAQSALCVERASVAVDQQLHDGSRESSIVTMEWIIALGMFIMCMSSGVSAGAVGDIVSRSVAGSSVLVSATKDIVLARFVDGTTASEREQIAGSVGTTCSSSPGKHGLFELATHDGIDPFEATEALILDARVASAMPNVVGDFASLPADPDFDKWWFRDFPERDSLSRYFDEYHGSDLVVAVLMDTGLDIDHLEFKNRRVLDPGEGGIFLFPSYVDEYDSNPIAPGFDETTSPRDLAGHGTAMATYLSAIWFADVDTRTGAGVIDWRGITRDGEPVASGIYFARIEGGSWFATRKLVVLR